MLGSKSRVVVNPPRASGSTRLFMFNYAAIIAEVQASGIGLIPGFQTVMVSCNKMNGLLTVFFLCCIRYSLSSAVYEINV